jgi:hypothetical protein
MAIADPPVERLMVNQVFRMFGVTVLSIDAKPLPVEPFKAARSFSSLLKHLDVGRAVGIIERSPAK